MSLLVGVDAGASHTEAAVAREDLRVLGRQRGAPGAVRPGGAAGAARTIRDAVRAALREAGVDAPPDAVVVGAAGAGSERTRQELSEALAEAFEGRVRPNVTTDAAIALEAAFAGGTGIVLLAGSGSIGYGRDASGNVWRAGGLGREVGDEGSGYALGRDALSAVGRAADGRARDTALTEHLTRATGTDSAAALLAWARHAPAHEVAALARHVGEAALAGDPVARALVDQAARDLALHVAALASRFPRDEPVRVALAGGVLGADSPVRSALVELLAHDPTRVDLVDIEVDPPLGALRIAARLLG